MKAHDFIKVLEITSMSKTYKMPLLLAFYNSGNFKLYVTEEEIYLSFKEFYSKASNTVDLLKNKSSKSYLNWEKKDYLRIARNLRTAFFDSFQYT